MVCFPFHPKRGMKFLSYVQLLYNSPYHYITCGTIPCGLFPDFANPYYLSRNQSEAYSSAVIGFIENLRKRTKPMRF